VEAASGKWLAPNRLGSSLATNVKGAAEEWRPPMTSNTARELIATQVLKALGVEG